MVENEDCDGGCFGNDRHGGRAATGVADTIALGRDLPAGQMPHAAVRSMSHRPMLDGLDLCSPRIRDAAMRPPGQRRISSEYQAERRAEQSEQGRTVQDEPPFRNQKAGGRITGLARASPGRMGSPRAAVRNAALLFCRQDFDGRAAMTRVALVLCTAAGLLSGGRLALHTHLVKAVPAIDSTVTSAPTAVRLWFSTRPEPALSGVTLLGENNAPVAVVKLVATDDTLSVAGPIPVKLAPGTYTVAWKTGARDGHVVRGKYSFTYSPPPASTP